MADAYLLDLLNRPERNDVDIVQSVPGVDAQPELPREPGRVSYDLEKFDWIAGIAGYDGTLYLTANGSDYKPTTIGSQVTMLRLLFDDMLHPTYFTKLFDNGRGKIYRINYP